MAGKTVHYCNQIMPDRDWPTSLAKCGRWVPNANAYTEDGPQVSCHKCLATLATEDEEELAAHVKRFG